MKAGDTPGNWFCKGQRGRIKGSAGHPRVPGLALQNKCSARMRRPNEATSREGSSPVRDKTCIAGLGGATRHRAWPEGRAQRNRMTVGVPTAHGVACLHLTAASRLRCRAICERLFQCSTMTKTRVRDAHGASHASSKLAANCREDAYSAAASFEAQPRTRTALPPDKSNLERYG